MEAPVVTSRSGPVHGLRWLRSIGIAVAATSAAACVSAPTPGRTLASGEQVYRDVCLACHATKVEKSPQLGDREAWKPLIEEGQDVLTAHAWVGVRGMPPRGGKPDLTLEEFARATAYMARASGGDWKDPGERMLRKIEHEIEDRLRSLKEGEDEKK